MTACGACGHENQSGQKFCGECGALGAARSGGARNGRSSPRCSATWSGSPPRPSRRTRRTSTRACGLRRDGARRDRALWRRGREVHRGRRGRGVRRSRGARGRPGARGTRRSADRRGRRGAEGVGGAASPASGRHQHRRDPRRLGVIPGSGERFLAGDAINTAARIQSVAPAVGSGSGSGPTTRRRAVFEYEELEPAELKGKAEPVRVFHANGPARQARDGCDADARHPVRGPRDRSRVARRQLR